MYAPRRAAHSLYDVSCAAVGECVAVGDACATSNCYPHESRLPLAAQLHAGTWRPTVLPRAAGPRADAGLTAMHVACPSIIWCEATGDLVFDAGGFTATLAGGAWNTRAADVPIGHDRYPPGELDCTAVGECTTAANAAGKPGNVQVAMLRRHAGTWSARVIALPPEMQGATNVEGGVTDVDCVSPTASPWAAWA